MAAAGYPIPRSRPGWLYGPAPDLLIGAGAAYLVSVPLLLAAGRSLSLDDWPLGALLLLGLLLSTPHYGATLLRVYERAEDRKRYVAFSVYASLALFVLFVVGLHRPGVGAALITLYVGWSPWHFAGQNYGLSLMFLRRGGLEVPDAAKRVLYGAYLGTFVLALLVFQTADSSAAFAPDLVSEERAYDVLRIGIPPQVTTVLAPILLVMCIAGFGWACAGLRRAGASWGELVPVLMLALTQSLWFAVPATFAASGRMLEGLAFTAVWASVAHSAQYLWVTSFYARRTDPGRSLGGYYAKSLLAGCMIGAIPGLLFAPTLLGTRPWSGGLAILIFAMINLHHFVLDGAVWKLRDGRVARLLLRDGAVGAPPSRGRPWLAASLWSVGALCLLLEVTEAWDVRAARSTDLSRVQAAATRLAWIGRERTSVLGNLADLYVAEGDGARAIAAWRHALTIRRDPAVLNNLAWHLATRAETADTGEAVALVEVAQRLFGEQEPSVLDTLAATYASDGRNADAVRTAERALALARQSDPALASDISERLARYRAGFER